MKNLQNLKVEAKSRPRRNSLITALPSHVKTQLQAVQEKATVEIHNYQQFVFCTMCGPVFSAFSLMSNAVFAESVFCRANSGRTGEIIFWSSLFIYSMDHYKDHLKQGVEKLSYTKKVLGMALHIAKFFCIASLLFCLWALLSSSIAGMLIFLAFFTIGVLWNVRVISIGGKKKRFKDVPFVKSILLTFALMLGLVVLPISNCSNLMFDLTTLKIVLLYAVELFSNVVMFDVRDYVEDRVDGVPTLPVIFGVRNTKAFLLSMNVVLMIMLQVMDFSYSLITNFSITWTLFFVANFDSNTEKKTFLVFGEGLGLLRWGLFMLH